MRTRLLHMKCEKHVSWKTQNLEFHIYFGNELVDQGVYIMRLKRLVAFVLSFLILFNVQAPLLAERDVTTDGPQLHTVTWTMDPEYSLEELVPERTTMTDEGQVYANTEGPARTEIQSVYHADQTLVSVSLAGTSFSFAPIMHDNYFLESGIGEADSTGVDKDRSDEREEPDEESEPMPEVTETPALQETPDPDNTTAPQETNNPTDTPMPQETPNSEYEPIENPTEKPTENPTEKPTEMPTEVPEDDGEDINPEETEESNPDNTPAPEEEKVHTGYGKTIVPSDLFERAGDKEPIGNLPAGVIVYIHSLTSQQWAQIAFDTPDEIVEGYIRTSKLMNLKPEDEQQIIDEIKAQTEHREWKGHPLPRTEKYTVHVPETEAPVTDTPQLDITPAPEATDNPQETETPDKEEGTDSTDPSEQTDTPTSSPTDTPVPETTEPEKIETPVPDPTESANPTDSPVPEETDTPVPENTDAPAPEITETPASESDIAPQKEITEPSVPNEPASQPDTEEAESTPETPEEPAGQPNPAEAETVPETSEETTEETEGSVGAALLKLFFSSAYAEEEETLPEEIRVRPSSISGQKIGDGGATKMRMLRSAAPAPTGFNAAVYPGLFDIATDVRLSVSTTGVKEDILVSQYTGNHVYAYQLNTEGLTASLNGKEVHLCDADGNCLARIDAPNMTDVAGNYSTDIEVTLEANGDGYVLTYEPNDEWMQEAVYPVTIDPTGQYFNYVKDGIADVYVSSKYPNSSYLSISQDENNLDEEGNNIYAGTRDDEEFIAYICPSLRGFKDESEPRTAGFPDDFVLDKVYWHFGVYDMGGDGKFRVHLITSDWNQNTLTYNNRPSLSTEIYKDVTLTREANHIDITEIFAQWLTSYGEKKNYGFAITSSSSWVRIFSSNIMFKHRLGFTATYYTNVTPNLTVNKIGGDANSGKGWVELKWNAVEGANNYLLGIWTGKGLPEEENNYSYHFIGNTTSYSTQGKKLWITEAENNNNQYAIHWDGSGRELTTYPRKNNTNANYYFTLRPVSICGQVSSASKTIAVVLDKLPPKIPDSVEVNPKNYTNAAKVTVTWKDIKDEPLKLDSMSGGKIQYALDPDINKAATSWTWKDTGSNKADGSFSLDVSKLNDGPHAIYIRGIDKEGNYGAAEHATIQIDRTGPSAPTKVSVVPKNWTPQKTGSVSWEGITDRVGFRVQYCIDKGNYVYAKANDGKVIKSGTATGVNIPEFASLSDGEHTISIRGVDDLGNIGKATDAKIKIDRTIPTLSSISVNPANWTNKNEVTLAWSGAKAGKSGISNIAWAVDNNNYQDLNVKETGIKDITITSMTEGKHDAYLKVTNGAGTSIIQSTEIKIDRSAPAIGTVSAEPDTWTALDEIILNWNEVVDAFSGLHEIQYSLDENNPILAFKPAPQKGYVKVNVSALKDGEHSLTLYASDKLGYQAQKTIKIYIDHTSPVINEWQVAPSNWSHETKGVLAWSGVSDETSGLAAMSYQIDNMDLVSLDFEEDGTELDLSALSDGKHTITFRVTDKAGVIAEDTETLYIDRTPPVIEEAIIDPDVWADTDTLNISWTGAMDASSKLVSIEYSLDDGLSYTDLETKENGEGEISVSEIPDGEHELLLRLTDEAQNETIIPLTYQIDRTPPEVEILSPAEEDIVSGVLDIQGSVTDISLTDWVFKAWDDAGETVELQGNEEKQAEQLGLLDTSVFPDGDEIFMTLTAHDAAGHETISEEVCVKANHKAQKVSADVEIIAPENNEILSDVQTSGQYELKYIEEEAEGIVILDRNMVRNTEDLSFPLYPIIYPENTSHTVSVISTDENGQVHYSQGYQSTLAFSDLFQSEENIASSDNVQFGETGAVALSDNASFTLNTIFFQRDAMAVRIHCLSNNVSEIACEYSLDQGENWLPLDQNRDAVFPVPQSSIQIRCAIGSAGTVLQGLDLTEIHESNPVRFKSTLLRAVSPYTLIIPAASKNALLSLEKETDETFSASAIYTDGVLQKESNTVSLLPYEDNTRHTIAQAGLNEGGVLYGSGAHAFIILRSVPDAINEFESGQIDLAEDTYILRTEALFMDEDGNSVQQENVLAYSLNGTDWTDMPLSEYCFLPGATRTLWLRAALPEGVILKGLHVEGISLKNTAVIPTLVKPVNNVVARDYGQFSGDQKRYVLTWTDPNETDETLKNTIFYDIYRNGEQIASVLRTTFTDTEYVQSATYEVAARRVYEDPEDGNKNIVTRNAKAVPATVKVIQAPVVVTPTPMVIRATPTPPPVTPKPTSQPTPKPVVVTAVPTVLPTYYAVKTTPVPAEGIKFIDFEDTTSIYANMKYVAPSEIPALDFSLDQDLLGPRSFCSLGFEPINFNTGNFYVEARDFEVPDISGTGLDFIRTYNSQSLTDGSLFGNKWSCEADQILTMNDQGVLCWRRSDGSLVRFMKKEDGRFITDTTEFEAIAETEDGYLIQLTDGTGYGFDKKGNLNQIHKNNGQQRILFVRNVEGSLVKIILPSGKEVRVETNKQKQITKIWLTDTSCVRYTYNGNMLAEVTDTEGNKTRYEYDPEGQMTAWYDGNGVCQARNIYDAQNRVVAQTDANGGEYHLEYGDNYTIATDAEGNSITYIRDEQQRTSKIIDAQGGETLYIYGGQSEIISEIDPLGNVTTYSYNDLGDKISSTDARGNSVFFEWDGAHHLLSSTDQNGNKTSYTYDKKGNLLTETAPDGGITSYSYDENGQILSVTDALGYVTSYTYDKRGLLETETDPLGNKTAYTYDENGYPASRTNALGETTLTRYDAKGNLLKITYADHTSVSYTYDALGRMTAMTDPKGNTSRYQYDGLGQLIRTTLPDGSSQEATYTKSGRTASVTDALGNAVSYTFDANGNRLTATDADGYTTTDTYDGAGHLLKETNALGGETVYTYDSVGLPLAVKDPVGGTQTFEYDGCGNILTRILSNGAKIVAEYDSMNRVICQKNAVGGETRISYDLLGRITEVTDPLGAKTTYSYDANGNLLTATDALGNTLSYTYDALNRVTEEKAPNGAVTKYEYDLTGNLIASTDAHGNKTAYEYDANGNLAVVRDTLGQVTTLKYDKVGQAVSARQKNGGILATAYDKAGRVASETDANGNQTKYSYNKRGLTTEITDALNQKANIEYDALRNVSRITAPDGSVTLYTYDLAGRLEKTTDPAGCETVYTYNAAGQIASSTVNGNPTAYEYDDAGNISAATDAEGRTVRFEYDLVGNITEVIYPDGSKDTTEYDVLGRVIRQIPRTGLSTEYAYDELGNTISVKQGDRTTQYEYDLLSRLVKTIAPDGTETSYEYDAIGNLITSTDPLGNKTAYAYTPESLLERVTYANGSQQLIAYDLAGNVLSETDAEGYTKKYQYDKVNRLTAVTDELGHRTSYTYDAADNLAQVKDALGHITSYVYDNQGNLTEETDALGNTVRYIYTPEGWLGKAIKADGTEISFAYDKTGNLLTQKAGDEYIVSTGYNEMGQVTRLSSKEGEVVYQYNEQGYLVSVTNVKGETVRYTYDAYGNKETMILPDGQEIRYTYDALNRMTGVTGTDGETTRYVYDATGRRIKTESSTLTTAYEYDSVGNLLKQITEGDSNISFSYNHNRNGYITKEIRTENGEATESNYTYDALGQLTAFRQSTGYGEKYTYDVVGNMTQKVITPENKETSVTLKMQYNKGNQLTEMSKGKDRITYSYDPNGSMVQKVLNSQKYGILTDTYTYDVMDQLTGYTGYDGYAQVFTYDAGGIRLKKQEKGNINRSTLEELLRGSIEGLPEIVEPGTVEEGYAWATTEYLYDITEGYYQVLRETTTNGRETSTESYIYGLERIAGYTADTKTSYIYDGRGSVAQTVTGNISGKIIDPQNDPTKGATIQSYWYTPFGEQQHTKVSGFTYNAEAYDVATGMLNLRARQYEPAMNRFGQKDILKGRVSGPLSLNRYIYCENSPVMLMDPSGKEAFDAALRWGAEFAMADGPSPVLDAVAVVAVGVVGLYSLGEQAYNYFTQPKQETVKTTVSTQVKKYDVQTPIDYAQHAGATDLPPLEETQTVMDIAKPVVQGQVITDTIKPAVQDARIAQAQAWEAEFVGACEAALAKAKNPANKYTPGNDIHHIVPQSHQGAAEARAILKNNGIDPVNDSRNKVQIKTQLHKYLHTDSYVNTINNWVKAVNNLPKPLVKPALNLTLATAKTVIKAINYLVP